MVTEPYKDWIPEGQINTNKKGNKFVDFVAEPEPQPLTEEEVKQIKKK